MARRILIAEDEFITGVDLCDTVAEAGYWAEGPHTGISSAMLAFQKARPDLAILDIVLADGIVFPLAEKLVDEQVPVIFYSGQASAVDISDRFPQATILVKPCPPSELLRAVEKALTQEHEVLEPAE